jgi:hypothetical protein
MNLYLGGSLAWYDPHKRSRISLVTAGPRPLKELLTQLSIPESEVAVISVNGQWQDDSTCLVEDRDFVSLYPPMGGG